TLVSDRTIPLPSAATPLPYTTLFRSKQEARPKKEKMPAHRPERRSRPPQEQRAQQNQRAGDDDNRHRQSRLALVKIRPIVRRKRSEEHTSELQSPDHLVCCLLLEKKK